jgi:hypothetical protein
MAWGGDVPQHPAAYYRRKAARARQVAEEVTTRVMKARLLEEAVQYDRLAANAERGQSFGYTLIINRRMSNSSFAFWKPANHGLL